MSCSVKRSLVAIVRREVSSLDFFGREQRTAMRQLVAEAFNGLFAKHAMPEIAPTETRGNA
jgi:hypothetical protein